MNNEILNIISKMRDDYGDDIFLNPGRANNMLKDLAPDMPKERLQIRNILEMGAYTQLKRAETDLPLIKNKLVRAYADTYCVDADVAAWTVELISAAAGYGAGLGALPAVEKPLLTFDPKYRNALGAGMYHSVALRSDGTVHAAGNNECGQCNVGHWRNVTAVAAGGFHTAAVKRDGTVLAAGDNLEGQCEVGDWSDIISLHASSRHTVGLRADGRVVACGRNKNSECDVGHWRNIVGIAVDFGGTYGIKSDGTVVAVGDIPYDRYDVTALSNVSALAGMRHRGLMLALKRDGAAVKPRGAAKWPGMVALAATRDCFIGLTNSGKVKILEYYWASSGVECNLDGWNNIIAIAAGGHHALGLRADGTVMAAMLDSDPQNDEGQCEGEFSGVGLWTTA